MDPDGLVNKLHLPLLHDFGSRLMCFFLVHVPSDCRCSTITGGGFIYHVDDVRYVTLFLRRNVRPVKTHCSSDALVDHGFGFPGPTCARHY